MRSPLTGLIASAPIGTPVFSRSAERRSISVRASAWATYASTSARRSGAVRLATSGSSGARTMNVAPYSVSGRVVKTRSSSPPAWCGDGAVSNTISAPEERPIQFVCIALIGSGHSIPPKSNSPPGELAAPRGPAHPVWLHPLDRLGPLDPAEVQQLVGVVGRPQVPLRQLALLDLRAAAPAVAIDALHLFAGERPVVGAPVDRRHRPVRQARLV